MSLIRCPECRKKISSTAKQCPHCGFPFDEANLEAYKQKLEQRRAQNAEINRQSVKIHLTWGIIFTLVIAIAGWWVNR